MSGRGPLCMGAGPRQVSACSSHASHSDGLRWAIDVACCLSTQACMPLLHSSTPSVLSAFLPVGLLCRTAVSCQAPQRAHDQSTRALSVLVCAVISTDVLDCLPGALEPSVELTPVQWGPESCVSCCAVIAVALGGFMAYGWWKKRKAFPQGVTAALSLTLAAFYAIVVKGPDTV